MIQVFLATVIVFVIIRPVSTMDQYESLVLYGGFLFVPDIETW